MKLLEVSVGTTLQQVNSLEKRTKFQSADNDRALFKLPYQVVKTLLTADNDSISDTSLKIRRQFVKTFQVLVLQH